MATDVLMPQMGESIAEGTVVKWLKQVGDQVQRDEPLFEISTDKVDAEIPSTAAGTLVEILAKEGDTVTVNSVVARIGEAGAAAAPAPEAEKKEEPKEASAAAAAPAAPEAPEAPAPEAPEAAEPGPGREDPALAQMQESMKSPQTAAAPPEAEKAPAPAGAIPSPEESRRTRSSPLVRNIAREHGVDLAQVTGTGLAGRVTKDDILNFIEQGKGRPQPAAPPAPAAKPAAPAPTAPAAPAAPAPAARPAAGERVQIEPMSIMRRKIAEHMVMSRRTSAHVTTFFEVDYTNIARLRDRVKKSFEERNGVKLTFLPFVIKAAVDALKALPVVNASVDGENIVYKQDVNVGIAVALDNGLIVPVVKHADELSLVGLARATQDLAQRARNKQLKPDEVAGGTFSITNFGLYGGYTATPIINQPQVAILGIGGIAKRPWVIESEAGDAIAIRWIGVVSLSFDHRIIDGAVADQFMAHLKKTLETTDFTNLV
ncbi:MAG TPA: dihydrolipoamide acetyltransferase family protein [Blastocatellia bacterium]|nr:dihydrolipoamide acetyltransferase family protein [Blastocatellia bacterium]